MVNKQQKLAPYAVMEQNSPGRVHKIDSVSDRNEFQRDYTRLIHTDAFRRLQYKTQVFSNEKGDIIRTRLTHSLEVEHLARAVSRELNLNEDLAAVLAVSHDLGHAPFGHLGQDVLSDLMKDHGGFEHNWQVIRIVNEIESPYLEYEGLNLMFETLEGLLKHCSQENAGRLGNFALRHLTKEQPTLESQVVDMCDAIAYVHADLEDAYKMKVLSLETMWEAPGFSDAVARVSELCHLNLGDNPIKEVLGMPPVKQMKIVGSAIREMRHVSVQNLIRDSKRSLKENNIKNFSDVRAHGSYLIKFSDAHFSKHKELKHFSKKNIYDHPTVLEDRDYQSEAVRGLFTYFETHPKEIAGNALNKEDAGFYRVVSDYVSQMTDRFALSEYARLKKVILQEQPALPKSRTKITFK